jgi:hypothetical protein
LSTALRQRPGFGGLGLPPSDAGGGGGGGGWALLTTARNHVIAHLISGRLAQEAIEVMLDTSNPALGAWMKPFGDPMAPVRIFVRRRDLDRAAFVLHEVDHRPPDADAPASPAMRAVWCVLFGSVAAALLLEIVGLMSAR